MAQAEQKTSYEKVKAAASTFAAYLEANALPVHYIQVRLPDYPIRRVDHETGLSPYRKDQVKSIFTWSEAQRRWTRKDGGILVAETEIWQVVQYFIKATVQVSAIELCNTIDERVEGIYHGDVDKVWRLWKNSGLSRAEFSQNAQWIGRKPLKLSGPYGRPPSTARINFLSAIPSSTAHHATHDNQLGLEPSDLQKGPYPYLHPNRPNLLYVGRSRKGGTSVWVTIVGSEQQQLRYLNHTLDVVSMKDLDVIWHPHLELNVFQGRHDKEKERTRRQHIIKLIEDSTTNASIPSEDTSCPDTSRPGTPTPMSLRLRPSTRKRRQTNIDTVIDDLDSDGLSDSDSFPSPSKLINLYGGRRLKKACDEEALPLLRVSTVETERASAYDVQPGKSGRSSGHMIDHATSSLIDRVEGQTVPSKGIHRTILRVSTSNKPAKAPMNILLGACRNVDEFYSKVLSQCTTSADEVPELSAVFTWNGRGNLIRKGNHDDWSFFYEDLQRSWKRDIDNFPDGTCEIEIMLHVEN